MPEDKMQQNIDFLEKIIEKGHNADQVALAAAEVLPDAKIGIPLFPPFFCDFRGVAWCTAFLCRRAAYPADMLSVQYQLGMWTLGYQN